MQKINDIYFELLREVERTIKILGEAQMKAEEMYVSLSGETVCENYTNKSLEERIGRE